METQEPGQWILSTHSHLDKLYGSTVTGAREKEVGHIHPVYRPFIEHSSFVIIGTAGRDSTDVSPRGDPKGKTAWIMTPNRLLIPDRKGNNRIDTLRNLVDNPRIGLLFMISGVNESLRVNGTASLSVEPALLELTSLEGKAPRCVIDVNINSVFFQCPRAAMRGGLWNQAEFVPRSKLPSVGQILHALAEGLVNTEEFDRTREQILKETLY
ncbi:MSMEG_1061 family FMN-dependent PPOX-type flavoprotein [Hydrogenophaga sp. BPS33]|uniref:MSMEG_1061 family FMN-dependent PPOX-type flavoprotein n=1 Tax=Hydrogenophaga sp. BPS33 TaxID=2651974 RepID=UPI00131FF0C2|nr:MSMEG_1061 family FMN-dependent PPOX-type flavoprotein [Hydrogenophaga sp. BPS33]QHE84709.1 pyridoxamine 5'-phosphate oxidase family protein [Hydrogenophaga sp. BPS33]